MELTDKESKQLDAELKDFWRIKNRAIRSFEHYRKAIAFDNKGQYDKALVYFEKSLAIVLKDHGSESPDVAKLYHSIGFTWRNKGEYEKALEFYSKCLGIVSETYKSMSYLCFNIGYCHARLKRHSLAIDFLKKSISISKSGGGIAQIAKCYEALGNKELALDYFIQSAEIRKNDPAANEELVKTTVKNALRLAKELGKEKELPNWITN
jgi:tetratricopeptide (TPR) repeat protein